MSLVEQRLIENWDQLEIEDGDAINVHKVQLGS